MEKFVIDLDKVLNDFEFNEDCAEQITSVATSTIDASTVEKLTTESVPPKTYSFNSEKNIAIDVIPSFEKHRDIRSMDIDCRHSLSEKSIVSDSKDLVNNFPMHNRVNDNKTGQKLCIHTRDSDQISSITYNDISHNLAQRSLNGSGDSKDGDRYDIKLNQPNIKPSISNVFNSLNEYINAPTRNLGYTEPVLDETNDLPKMSVDNTAKRDFKPNKVTNEDITSKEKKITDAVDTDVMDCRNNPPVKLGAFLKIETVNDNHDDASISNIASQFISMQFEQNDNNVETFASNINVSRHKCDNVVNIEISNNEMAVSEKATLSNDTLLEDISKNIIDKEKQLDSKIQNPVNKSTFVEIKESIMKCAKFNETINDRDDNKETVKCYNILSNMRETHTVDVSSDFSEKELNRYLLELEQEEEKSKTQNILCADDVSMIVDESRDFKAVTQHEQNNEDINEAPIFEKIMIGELPKISEEIFQEKAKKFPVIDYGTSACDENVFAGKMNLREFNDTAIVVSNEKSDQLKDVQNNELSRAIKDNDVTGPVIQDTTIQQNTTRESQSISSVIVIEKAISKLENVEEQCNSHNMLSTTQILESNINVDAQLQNNNDKAVKSLLENKNCNEKIYCRDIIESKEDVHDKRMHDGDMISKTEIMPNIIDVSAVSQTDENDQVAEKPSRPQTLDIVSTHNKDSHILESSSITSGEAEPSEIGPVAEEDRGVSSDVSDNSLIEYNTILGKQPPFWVPDSDAPSCMLCDVKFTVLKRRHHCRACGKVLCNKCCNMRFKLEYQGNIDSRVCVSCYHVLMKADSEQATGDWPAGYNSCASCSDVNSPQGRQPNPNNPMEYCSTIPPLQQLAGGLPPPPTVMVPVGVLKREGSKHRTEGQKSVMFSDGIRPGCDLTELDTCWDPKPPYRKQGNKRILASGSTLADTQMRRQSHPSLDNVTNSYIPHDPDSLPPTVTIHKGQITYHPSMDENVLYKTLKNECEPPVMFAINRNLYAYVKITNLNCCVNKICWNVTSRGLACVGQDEVILLVEMLPDETRIPKDLLMYINQLYFEAIKGNTMTELGFLVYQGANLLSSREHAGFLFVRQTLQCLQKIILPPAPFLIGLLIHRWETPWAKVFPLRLLLRLGAEYRYYPCPLVSVRFRDALYYEIGHTVMKVLADFRNFGYTLPGVRGLTIHLKNRTTDVMFPRNRYDQVIKGLHNSNDHVLAYASNFSIAADSHLVCIQTNTGDESSYQTQAINIHNKPRTVTGASFIVINGALKSSMGLSAKSSIVEDGLMVEIMPEKMESLKAALKNMQDFSIGCGRQGASEPDETVNIKWVDNDVQFNLGVKSPIDSQLMDGIPSIRVHNGTDYKGTTRFIRWTEVFIIKSDDHSNGVNDPVDINKLSGSIAKATCAALVKLLDLLATAGLTKLGVRATIHPDNVGYEAGSEGTKLPPIYMKSLDNELIQVLHKAAQSSQDAHTVLELIFFVLED